MNWMEPDKTAAGKAIFEFDSKLFFDVFPSADANGEFDFGDLLPMNETEGLFAHVLNTGDDFSNSAVLTTIYAILALAGFAVNIIFCITVWRNEKLHTVTHMLMTNLAVSNLLLLAFHPAYVITTYFWRQSWIFGDVVCKLSYPVPFVTSTASFYFMSLVAVDRWLAIFKRKHRLNRTKCIVLTTGAWMISVLVATPYSLLTKVIDVHEFNQMLLSKFSPTNASDISSAENLKLSGHWVRCNSAGASSTLVVWTVAIQFLIPLLIMIPTYGHLAHFVWQRAPVGVQSKERTKKAYRRRRKLLITLLAIVVFLVICWSPLFIVNILFSKIDTAVPVKINLYISCSLIAMIGVLSTPILYLVNDGCWQQILSILRCCRKVSTEETVRLTLLSNYPKNDSRTGRSSMQINTSSQTHTVRGNSLSSDRLLPCTLTKGPKDTYVRLGTN